MKVLLVGHGCDPFRGSEPGVTWNWAWHLAEHHEVWLLTHPGARHQIARFLESNKRPNLHIQFVEVPPLVGSRKRAHGIRGLQLIYIRWLKMAFGAARRLSSEVTFDVVHHVGWTTIAVPSPFWKLGLPFIWGPLGGGQKAPAQFKYLFGIGRLSEWIREANIATLPLRPAFRNAVRRSSRVLAANHETAAVLRRAGISDVQPFLDCGISPDLLQKSSGPRHEGKQMTVLWGGALEARKGLPLAIQAMARLAPSSNARLIVAGDGPRRAACEALCRAAGVSNRIEFLGSVPLEQMYRLMQTSNAFLFTSVRDTFGSILLEAAAHKLPIIALDHHGVAAWLPNDAAIKVPVKDVESTVSSLAAAIGRLETDPDLRRELGEAAYTFACRNTWQERARTMTAIYAEAVSAALSVRDAVQQPALG